MTLSILRNSPDDNSSAFRYSVCSGNAFLVGLIRLLRRLLKRTHRRATGLALRAVRPLQRQAAVRLADGSLIAFTLGDAYWNPFIWDRNFDYEPEIRHVLQRLTETNYVFVDAGANIGYWSILVSSEMLGRKAAIAIEASQETFALLQRNSEANHHRFQVLRKAIFERDGERLTLSKGPHVARHLLGPGDRGDVVESLTLDTLAREYGLTDRDLVVVKLDVEGAERLALNGCRILLQRDTLVIYEDHGNDKAHATTQYILRDLCLAVFAITADGTMSEITELCVLDRIKTDPFRGYNFIACPPGSYFYHWLIRQTKERDKSAVAYTFTEAP